MHRDLHIDELPHEDDDPPRGEWDALLTGWLALIDPACAGCGYPLKDVPRPVCPECGRHVTADDLTSNLVPRGTPLIGREPARWSILRALGAWNSWLIAAMLTLIMSVVVGGFWSPSSGPLFFAAAVGAALYLPVAWLHAVGSWFLVDHFRFWRKLAPTTERPWDTFFIRLRGLIVLWVAACDAMALLAVILRF